MEQRDPQLRKDIERIQALDIVPSILELICKTTGMGFSAVARVTETHWIACAVRDEINFGLQPGGELELETTICNEIRDHGQPVVIDEVRLDEQFFNHHTPKKYGFQSYISIPIFLKTGQFFGTLCAIDPRPFPLKAGNMVTMLSLFADLIAYHLHTQDQMLAKTDLLERTQHHLESSLDDIRQFSHIGRHTLQEPLRKLRVFSDMIVKENSLPADHKVKQIAGKINSIATDFSMIIQGLTEFSGYSAADDILQIVDLNLVLKNVIGKLQLQVRQKNGEIITAPLHHIIGIPQQINKLFYYILDNALRFSRPGVPPLIRIYSGEVHKEELTAIQFPAIYDSYCKVVFEDNGIGINASHLEKIFDLFVKLHSKETNAGLGMGLSQSKKIMLNHEGVILVSSVEGTGSSFSLIFPVDRKIS